MIHKLHKTLLHLPIVFLLFITLWLRLYNLGYSDYQGDEIKALYLPEPGQTASQFLLDQRKGPLQFVATYLIKFIDPEYTNRFFVRFPFALAGTLSIYFFYSLVRIHFGKKAALYASLFLATNGFFIAFSRIVQYQSFVILFAILALYFFTQAITYEKWHLKGVYLGFISWALSIFAHYDGVFIAPFVLFLLSKWFESTQAIPLKDKFRHLILSATLFFLMLASFYIPFVFSISSATKDYWQNRLSGGGDKTSSSQYLFQVYHPIYVVHFYKILGVAGLIAAFLAELLKKLKVKGSIKDLLSDFIVGREWLFLIIWMGIPLIFFELIVNIPGTHIFNYLLPLTILLGLGVAIIEETSFHIFRKPISNIFAVGGLTLFFGFLFLQSSAVFVDHKDEYPWENEKFLIWEFHMPSPVFHLSMFGFPYYRNWGAVGEYIRNDQKSSFYSTNERKSISRYHINLEKDTDKAGYLVLIKNPQSFTEEPVQEKAEYWMQKYKPVKIFLNEKQKELARIYLMPEGDIALIKNLGY